MFSPSQLHCRHFSPSLFSLCKSLLLHQGSKQKPITIFMSPPMTNESRSTRKNKIHSLLRVHRILIILSTAIIFSIPLMLLLHPHNFYFHSIFTLLSVKSPFRSRERTVRVCVAHYDADGKAKHLVLAYVMRCTVCPTCDREGKKINQTSFFPPAC